MTYVFPSVSASQWDTDHDDECELTDALLFIASSPTLLHSPACLPAQLGP